MKGENGAFKEPTNIWRGLLTTLKRMFTLYSTSHPFNNCSVHKLLCILCRGLIISNLLSVFFFAYKQNKLEEMPSLSSVPKNSLKLFSKGNVLPCGSIKSGHLLEFPTMIPLSTEKESTGRPAMFQARIFTGSPSVTLRENVSEHGMCFS